MRRAETKRQTRAVELILEDIETESWRDDMPLRLIRFSEAAVNLSFSLSFSFSEINSAGQTEVNSQEKQTGKCYQESRSGRFHVLGLSVTVQTSSSFL